MNLIVICLDSLRQDHVSFYHPDSPVATPNLDRLARRSVSFTNVYPEALPTIPVRTQLMIGQRTLPNHPWQPLARGDRTLAELLGRYGYVSAFITDMYHYFKPDYNFHRGFRVWRWIRGQEYDPYRSAEAVAPGRSRQRALSAGMGQVGSDLFAEHRAPGKAGRLPLCSGRPPGVRLLELHSPSPRAARRVV